MGRLFGRGPEPVNLFQVTLETTDGKRIGGGQMSALPPVGYVFVEDGARVRGVRGWSGTRYRVVGGEFIDPSSSTESTRCVTYATVFVEKVD